MIYNELLETFRKSGSILSTVDGELQYTDTGTIPEHCVQLASEYENRLVRILNGEDLAQQWKRDNLFNQIMYFYRNVSDPSNDRIEEWMNGDQEAAALFMKLTTGYENCGWTKIEEAPFNFENEETKRLTEELYKNALRHFKKEAVTP